MRGDVTLDEIELAEQVGRSVGSHWQRAGGTVRWVAGMDLAPKGQFWLNGRTGVVE